MDIIAKFQHSGGRNRRHAGQRPTSATLEDPVFKNQKRGTGEMVRQIKHLPSKQEDQSLNPQTHINAEGGGTHWLTGYPRFRR